MSLVVIASLPHCPQDRYSVKFSINEEGVLTGARRGNEAKDRYYVVHIVLLRLTEIYACDVPAYTLV